VKTNKKNLGVKQCDIRLQDTDLDPGLWFRAHITTEVCYYKSDNS